MTTDAAATVGTAGTAGPAGWRTALRLAVIAVMYLASLQIGGLFLDPVERVAAIWPASGVAIAVLLLNPRRLWPAIIAVMSLINLVSNLLNTSFAASLGFMAADILEFGFGIWLITWVCGQKVLFTRVREILALIGVATLVNGGTAIVGATTTMLSTGAPFRSAYLTWWISNGLGILLITPLVVTWSGFRLSRAKPKWGRILEIAAFAILWCVTGWLRYRASGVGATFAPHPFLLVVLQVWAALRFGPRGVASALTVLGIIAISGVLADVGPFLLGGSTPTERLLMIQAYIGVSGMASLLLAASLTEARSAEQSARESAERLSLALDAARMGTWEWEIASNQVRWESPLDVIFGLEPGATRTSETFLKIIHPDDREPVRRATENMLRGNAPDYAIEYRIIRPDGSVHWLESRGRLYRTPTGKPQRVIGTLLDITQRKQAEQSLTASEELLRQFIKHTPAAVAMFDLELRYLQTSERWLIDYHLEGQEIIGKSHYEVFPDIPERWKIMHRRALAGSIERCDEDPFERADGTMEWLQWEVRPWHTAEGAIGGVIMFTQVITERKRAEESLQLSEERFRQVVENIQEVFWMTDVDKNRMLYISPGYEKIWGRTRESLYHSPTAWIESIHPDDRSRIGEAVAKQNEGDYVEEYRILRPDGSIRWIRDRAFPIQNADGRVYRIAGVAEDITEQRRIEEQLRQSQKMEAVGQMAGGVAHDFNNILGAIMMQAGLASSYQGLPPQVQDLLADMIASTERAADLTRQLLAFGRRQVMQPRQLDLNEVVTSLTKMLQRLLGEDVPMQLNLHPSQLMVYADAGMLDQVLVNLSVNARDAMPQGGRLVIETAARTITEEEARARPEIPPGRYVCLRVSDTGCGIPTENLPHIFEPFFTTKEPGKGTGLGLATVFGIVKQHRGSIAVSSRVGLGTAFEILLPASTSMNGPPVSEPVQPAPSGGAETIFVVEDDPAVLKLTRIVLEQKGYRVLSAGNGVEALRVWELHGSEVDLLLTDLVLPEGMSGHQLAARLQEYDPGLKVVFTSGYSPELAGRELKLKEGQNFLPKPCRPIQILDTVRRSLDS